MRYEALWTTGMGSRIEQGIVLRIAGGEGGAEGGDFPSEFGEGVLAEFGSDGFGFGECGDRSGGVVSDEFNLTTVAEELAQFDGVVNLPK